MNNALNYLPSTFSSRYTNIFKRVLKDPFLNADVKAKVNTPEFLQQTLELTRRSEINKRVLDAGLNNPLTDAGQQFFDIFLNNMVVEAYNFKWNPFYRNLHGEQLTEDQKIVFLESLRG